MIQLRPGDLVAVQKEDTYVLFAILTKQILFGGHWCFVSHQHRNVLPAAADVVLGSGFNAAVDFIVAKREQRVFRISRGNDFSSLMGPELLQQPPLKGQSTYRFWKWKNGKREEAEYIRFTPSPTREEVSAPHYSCIGADFAFELAAHHWNPSSSMWPAQQSVQPDRREDAAPG